MNGALLDSRAIRVSMAKQTVSRPEQQGSGAPVAPGLRPWSAPPVPLPKVASSQPANIIQAQAQARLMQLSALNMLVPAVAATPAAGPGKSKKPQHDPGKVKRTIFVSKLPQDVSEQARLPAVTVQPCGCQNQVQQCSKACRCRTWPRPLQILAQ